MMDIHTIFAGTHAHKANVILTALTTAAAFQILTGPVAAANISISITNFLCSGMGTLKRKMGSTLFFKISLPNPQPLGKK